MDLDPEKLIAGYGPLAKFLTEAGYPDLALQLVDLLRPPCWAAHGGLLGPPAAVQAEPGARMGEIAGAAGRGWAWPAGRRADGRISKARPPKAAPCNPEPPPSRTKATLTSGLNFTQNRRFEFAVAAAAGAVD